MLVLPIPSQKLFPKAPFAKNADAVSRTKGGERLSQCYRMNQVERAFCGGDCQISAKEKGVLRRSERLSKFALVPGTQGRTNSQLYGL